MKRKGPPYEVEIGSKDQEPPAYVRYIHQDKIALGGNFESLGLKAEISYIGNAGQYEANPELIKLMTKLNNQGVCFSSDYKVMISPSDFMLLLQDKNVLKKAFKEISWRGKNLWVLTKHEVI